MVTIEKCQVELLPVHGDTKEDLERARKSISDSRDLYVLEEQDGESYYVCTKGRKVIGTTTYTALSEDRVLTKVMFRLEPGIFLKARDYFHAHPDARGNEFLVLNEQGQFVARLGWQSNLIENKTNDSGFNEFWDYEYRYPLVENVLNQASAYVFMQLEEYTFAIATYVMQHFPERPVFFRDEKAAWPIWPDMGGIRPQVVKDLTMLPVGFKYMFILSSNMNAHVPSLEDYEMCCYNSINVMYSMLWGSKVSHPGDFLPQKTVLLIDSRHPRAGLVDIIQSICSCAYHAERNGWLPVADLSTDNCCQYWEEGKNVWEELFLPLNQVGVKQARVARNLLKASDSGSWVMSQAWWHPHFRYSWHCADHPDTEVGKYYNEKTRLNDATWEYVCVHSPEAIRAALQEERIREQQGGHEGGASVSKTSTLGVVMRGTDFYKNASNADQSLEMTLFHCRKLMQRQDYRHLFLATEDAQCFRAFEREFGDRLICVEQPRVVLDYQKEYREVVYLLEGKLGGMELARRYITVLKCLSICDDLIYSTICGAARQAIRWNAGRYGFCHGVNSPYYLRLFREGKSEIEAEKRKYLLHRYMETLQKEVLKCRIEPIYQKDCRWAYLPLSDDKMLHYEILLNAEEVCICLHMEAHWKEHGSIFEGLEKKEKIHQKFFNGVLTSGCYAVSYTTEAVDSVSYVIGLMYALVELTFPVLRERGLLSDSMLVEECEKG
ncbi:hypothetical protein [Selenomonas sp. AB3002]|uniref:hypothetical protein n=1 Tax=Selenomonas sp. AB3002 TaxID=1392502 RepID=UPI0004985E8B